MMATRMMLLRLTLTALVASAVSDARGFSQRVCPGKPADLVVVMDESSSIWPVHFRKQREFLANLTDGFEISADKTRVAVVSFADDYTLRFNLDTFRSNEEVKAAVNRIAQKTGGTRTDLALEFVRTGVLAAGAAGRRGGDVPRIVILVTDGASWYPERTKRQADLLRKLNVTIIAVAISNQIKWDEINAIATKPLERHAFNVTSFEGLGQQLVSDLVDTTCEIKSEPSPVTMPHTEREPLGKPKPPGMPTIRIYSERTAVVTRHVGSDETLHWLQPEIAIDEKAALLPPLSERQLQHGSLQGRQGSFTERGGGGNDHQLTLVDNGRGVSGRSTAPDGKSAQRVSLSSVSSVESRRLLLPASISLSASWSSSRDAANAIELIPISVDHVARGQSSIATDARRNEHSSSLHRVLVHELGTISLLRGCRPAGRVDVAVVLGSIYQNPRGGDAAMSIVESFVRETASSLTRQQRGDEALRIALVPSGCHTSVGFGWSGLSSPQTIVRQLAQQRKGKLANVADHLDYVREQVFARRRDEAEANISRLAIVILDRSAADAGSTLQAVRRLQEQDVVVAFIAVGSSVEQDYLRTLVQSEQLFFAVDSYSHADAIKSYIHTIVCQ